MDKISVCMATYNGARFIRQQVDSILPQLSPYDEIIISDDGSTDETLSIISSYNDPRFNIIQSERSGLPARTFERGLRACSGETIFLTDQDDRWAPSKIKTMQSLLMSFDLVLSDCTVINDQDEVLNNSFFDLRKSKSGMIRNLIRNSYMGCCMAFNRNVLDRILPFPQHLKTHDQWIGLVAEKYCKVFFLNETLVYYRRHGANFSLTGEKSNTNLFEKIKHRAHMLVELSKR